MALSKVLADAGSPPASVDTTASVHLDRVDGNMTVTRIALDTTGDVPGMDEADFIKHAEVAKDTCPISRLLAPGAEITLTARLA